MNDTLTCDHCSAVPMVDPPTFEEWLTPAMESISRDMLQVGDRYFDRAGIAISFAESLWQGVVDPHYRVVKHTHYDSGGMVSTTHLHFNHAMPGEPILIFETMVFQVDGWDGYQERYTTEAEAIAGHEATVARVNTGKPCGL